VADALVNAGASQSLAGDPARAIGPLEESLAICQRRGELQGRTAARATVALAKALEEQGDYARALELATRALPFTEGESAHFKGAAAAPSRLQHARLLQRVGGMPADCTPVLYVLAIDGASDAVRNEATILAAACDVDNGRTEGAKARLASLPAGEDALAEVNPYALDRLRELRKP
jgi:hypothetical protein